MITSDSWCDFGFTKDTLPWKNLVSSYEPLKRAEQSEMDESRGSRGQIPRYFPRVGTGEAVPGT